MKDRIFRPRVPVPDPDPVRSRTWGARVPAPDYNKLRWMYGESPWLRTRENFDDLAVIERVLGYVTTRHLLWTAQAARQATSDEQVEALWNRGPVPRLFQIQMPSVRDTFVRLLGESVVRQWLGPPGSRTVARPTQDASSGPAAGDAASPRAPSSVAENAATATAGHETTHAGDTATGDDMSHGNALRPGATTRTAQLAASTGAAVPGKHTLTESLASPSVAGSSPAPAMHMQTGGGAHEGPAAPTAAGEMAPPAPRPTLGELFGTRKPVVPAAPEAPAVQMRTGAAAHDPEAVQAAAARGTATPASPLPHGESVQRSFGHHDVSQIQAHTGPEAAASAADMGATAYATGDHVVLSPNADLHTVAHEAAHVVQQRGGVQLKSGVGQAGDVYEQHADAIADKVVAGRSAEALLDQQASEARATPSVQRKESKEDAQLLNRQARLQNTDLEIPDLEWQLLKTRQEAVNQGLLSKAAYDASYDLSRAMTQLQPAVIAQGEVDRVVQVQAAIAAQQLFMALQRETAGDKNFHAVSAMGPGSAGGITQQNPYTEEMRVTTSFLLWSRTTESAGWLQQLPGLIHRGQWTDAFKAYRRLMDGLDLWVSDQLRRAGKDTANEALGYRHERNAQIRTGLEQIVDKHATRLPALFHPAPEAVDKNKAGSGQIPDTVPLNVYFWKDPDGKVHLYDMTAPAQPREQTIERQPTATAMNTFFEQVARYPEGEVRYRLPDGSAGVAPTTGKMTWYEWVGLVGLGIAGLGLALTGVGLFVDSALLSATATVCFAAGTLAGGISAGGHLTDSLHLGTATTTTVVLDAAQIAGSLASFGVLSIAARAGGAAAALGGSRSFVPLVGADAAAASVQLVALSDLTWTEMDRIQKSPGEEKDKQRAMTVLVIQYMATMGMTVLSVQGARNIRTLGKTPLELVEQNGVKVLRVAGDTTSEPVVGSKPATGDSHSPSTGTSPMHTDDVGHGPAPTESHGPVGRTQADASAPSGTSQGSEQWLAELERRLTPDEKDKLAKIARGKTPEQVREMLGTAPAVAQARLRAELRLEQERAAVAAQSKERVAELRKQIAERGLMDDPEIRAIVDDAVARNTREHVAKLRDKLLAKLLRAEAETAHPGSEVLSGVKIYEKLPEVDRNEWNANNPGRDPGGLTDRPDGLYMQRGEIDMMVIERQPTGKAKVVAREEIKTGIRDTNADARGQLDDQAILLRDGAVGRKIIRLEIGGRDITGEIDLRSDDAARKSTRGPAGKGFDETLGVSATDLEKMCKELLAEEARKKSP